MGRGVLSGASFIGTAGDNLKDAFLFQPLARSGREIEEPKGWKFKRF
jgi:hypothetical protein